MKISDVSNAAKTTKTQNYTTMTTVSSSNNVVNYTSDTTVVIKRQVRKHPMKVKKGKSTSETGI